MNTTKQKIKEDLKFSPKAFKKAGTEMEETSFKLNASFLWIIDKTQTALHNMIQADQINQRIKDQPEYPEIEQLRRIENKGTDEEVREKKTKIQKLIKDSLSKALDIPKEDVYKWILKETEERCSKSIPIQALEIAEQATLKECEGYLSNIPLYTNWLSTISGLGVKSSTKLMALIRDIRRFRSPSALWSYFGVGDPKMGKRKKGEVANYNHKAKSLVLGIICDNLIKQNSPYREIYDKRKMRTKVEHPEWHNLKPDGTKNDGKNLHPRHGEKDARRVMGKRFLLELWMAWYRSIGLEPPMGPYAIEKSGHHEVEPVVVYRSRNEIHNLNASQYIRETHGSNASHDSC